MDDQNVTRCVEAWRRGDPEALDPVIRWMTPRIYRFLAARCDSPATAEELTQDAAERIVTGLDGFQTGTRFQAWALTVAANLLRDHWRRQKREERPSVGDGRWPDDPNESLERADGSRDLWRAVTDLGDKERTVVTLRHVGGLSFREIATALDLPLGTVLSLQHRALAKLARTVKR